MVPLVSPASSGVLESVIVGGGQVTVIAPESVTAVIRSASAEGVARRCPRPGVPLSIDRSWLGPWQWCARDGVPGGHHDRDRAPRRAARSCS